jgi:acyl dehydratase
MLVDQERVGLFADATGDHQWIHMDEERCRRESPFGGTIAHGFLTLSLLPMLMGSAFAIEDQGMIINYGLNKVRFPSPVPTGSRIRARMKLLEMSPVEAGGMQMLWQVTMEREGAEKPACVAEFISRRYPGSPAS